MVAAPGAHGGGDDRDPCPRYGVEHRPVDRPESGRSDAVDDRRQLRGEEEAASSGAAGEVLLEDEPGAKGLRERLVGAANLFLRLVVLRTEAGQEGREMGLVDDVVGPVAAQLDDRAEQRPGVLRGGARDERGRGL